ncbi:hypothetical protein KRR38_01220 [Novosphingobium sp. G106]|uniref:hypothetical protein n=1 Tax=Novosphingobium sp. G106 TaxID=2849500 RepID=UPI001C2CC894|nr:hypothetical protein [Novosphingobium sp. G106]MBV1686324.1 hypothetical protein [Novosphingobium sp. G106]
MLNHLETLYRLGEREVAFELAEALGCAVSYAGANGDGVDTFLAVRPNPDNHNVQSNVFYMSQVTPEQQALERELLRLSGEASDLAQKLESYRQAARVRPYGLPHFSLRYGSADEIEEVVDRINKSLTSRLPDRLHLHIIRPGAENAAGSASIQGFLYQDVIVSGSFLMGQLIELQIQR